MLWMRFVLCCVVFDWRGLVPVLAGALGVGLIGLVLCVSVWRVGLRCADVAACRVESGPQHAGETEAHCSTENNADMNSRGGLLGGTTLTAGFVCFLPIRPFVRASFSTRCIALKPYLSQYPSGARTTNLLLRRKAPYP